MEFIKFIGNAALFGQQVAAYRDGEMIVLKAETVGGARIKKSYKDDQGKKQIRTVPEARMTKSAFESLEESWQSGSTGRSDARMVERAIAYLVQP